MANNAAIEQQHRHFEAELANQLGIGVDVDYRNRRQGMCSLEIGQTGQHLFTKPATLAGYHDDAPGRGVTLGWRHLR
jgi:hypothetical protein